MPSLPENPDIDQLRSQARRLQRAVRAGNPEGLALAAQHHPDGAPAEPAAFRLAAAQLTVARAYGFASWPRLVAHLEVVRSHLWRPDRPIGGGVADEFCRLACLSYTGEDGPQRWARARSLLAEEPLLVRDHVWAAAAANDLGTVRRLVGADRSLATTPGGPYGWRPLFQLVYSRVDLAPPADAVLGIARLLLDAGADPDEGYLHSGLPTPFTLLTGVFGEGEGGPGNQPAHPHQAALARLLLDAGADPNDGQTLYNRMFRPADDHLELLFEYGLGRGDGGPWKARLGDELDPPAVMLRDQLSWAVSHGQLDRVRLLAAHGVDVRGPFSDGRTPATVAAVNGHPDIVDALVGLGASSPALDPLDALVAAVMAGDAAAVVASPPEVVARLRAGRPGLLVWAAANGRRDAVALLLELGVDVDAYGRGDVPVEQRWETALHQAAANDDTELARLLLAAGADPTLRDTRFDGTPLDWAEHFGHAEAAAVLRNGGTAGLDSTEPLS